MPWADDAADDGAKDGAKDDAPKKRRPRRAYPAGVEISVSAESRSR